MRRLCVEFEVFRQPPGRAGVRVSSLSLPGQRHDQVAVFITRGKQRRALGVFHADVANVLDAQLDQATLGQRLANVVGFPQGGGCRH